MDRYDELFFRVAEHDDELAFKTLFDQFFSPLCVFACRYVYDRDECEDIVQEVFLKFWINRRKIVVRNSLRNLLVTAVKHSCIDFLRLQDEEQSAKEYLMEHPDDDDGSNIFALDELEQIMDKALSTLPANARRSFEMNRFECKTYSEIAALQNLSVRTVESHIAKALKLLRTELRDFLPPQI